MGEVMKKLAMLGAAATAIALLLTGCGASGGTSGPNNGTKINVAYWPGPELNGMKAIVAKYNAGQGQKDKVSVNLVTIAGSDMFNKELVEMSTQSSKFDMHYTASYLLQQHPPSLTPPWTGRPPGPNCPPPLMGSLKTGSSTPSRWMPQWAAPSTAIT